MELESLVDRGIAVSLPTAGMSFETVRQSAVLILFGMLDAIPAETGAIQLPPPSGHAALVHDPSHAIGSRISPDLDVLLLRRADRMRHHAGQIAFPGGGIDPDDRDAPSAALREAEEETGLEPSGVEVLGELPRIPISVSNNLVTPVLGWWKHPSEVAAVDHTESADVFRVPVADLLNPDARGTVEVRQGGQVFRSPGFQLSDRFGQHTVWGFTGKVLARLFDELDWTEPWDESRPLQVLR